MALWFSLAAAFALQEIVSTTLLLSLAYHDGYPLPLIHVLWFAISVGETALIYLFGSRIAMRVSHTRFGRWLEGLRGRFGRAAGRYGREFTVAIFALLFSPGLAAILAALFEMPFALALALIMLADLLWYLFEWATVLGIVSVSSNFGTTIALALAAALLVSVGIHWSRKRL